MQVLIIGTGYVGLTTGLALAYTGHHVYCLDVKEERIKQLKAGQMPFYEPHLDELFALTKKKLRFVSSYAEFDLASIDVAFICVGTPSAEDGSADMRYVISAAEAIADHLTESSKLVVVNKSTVRIGSGDLVAKLIRERYESKTGKSAENLFFMVSCPEFLKQGDALKDSLYPNRIIIGTDNEKAFQTILNLFEPLIEQNFSPPAGLPRPAGLQKVPVLNCGFISAEMIKYAANAFLPIKISFINEIARVSSELGGDIKAIATGIGMDERIGSAWLNAGLGWGGSCFGKDTAALISIAEEHGVDMPILKAARMVNYEQRDWAYKTLLKEWGDLKGKKVALLGFSFKPETDDLRDAPSIDISKKLISAGAEVRAHDPKALGNARRQYGDLGVQFKDDLMDAVRDADAIVLVTEWKVYRNLDWSQMPKAIILDGRNALDRDRLRALGFKVIGIGR